MKKQKGTDEKYEQLAWLGVTSDGRVFGQGIYSNWCLQLIAHEQVAITDVDVDPQGKWLATTSTDTSCRVSHCSLIACLQY